MASADKQPFLADDHLSTAQGNAHTTMLSPDLGDSIGPGPSRSHNDYGNNGLDSPPSPRSPRDIAVIGKQSTEYSEYSTDLGTELVKPSLSKKLFNLEHYVMIPLMFMLSFFVYYDRGGLASALDFFQEQLLHDNAVQSGAVASCYLFGFCLTSPIFAVLGSRFAPLKMSALGMGVWCLGTFLTGWPSPKLISPFIWLAGARLLTGIGEASFLAFAGTIIDIIAPDTSRALWLGSFYMGIPLGYAMGYAVGGTLADLNIYVVDTCNEEWFKDESVTDCNESWRAIFLIETVIVLPLCVVLYCIKQPPNMLTIKQAKDEMEEEALNQDSNMSNAVQRKQSTEVQDAPVRTKLYRLVTNKVFLFASAGYALQTFVTGTFAVDAITYLQKVYDWDSAKAGTTFGILTFVAGVSGSVFGGYVLDMLKAKMEHDSPPYLYCRPALKMLVVLSFLSFPFAFLVVLWNNVYVFFFGAGLTEFLIFASAGPVNNVILWAVLYEDRPLAAALNTLAIHALGDACAPLAIGAMVNAQTNAGKDSAAAYNFAFGIAVFWLIFSGIAFILGVLSMKWLENWMVRNGQTRRKTSLLINDPSHP